MSRDTSVTPYTHATYFLLVSTTICYKFHRNLLQSTAICYKFHRNLPQSAVSAKFCYNLPFLPNSVKSAEFHPNRDNARYSTVNLATKLMIYTPSSLFFTFFPYAMSWLHHIIHVLSLIISTLLYIIVAYTYFVTLCCVKFISILPCLVCRTTWKPLCL